MENTGQNLHIAWDIPQNCYVNTNGQELDPLVLSTASGLLKIVSRYCFTRPETLAKGIEIQKSHLRIEGVTAGCMIFIKLFQNRFPYLSPELCASMLGMSRDAVEFYKKKHSAAENSVTSDATSYRGLIQRIKRDFDHDYEPFKVIQQQVAKATISKEKLQEKTALRIKTTMILGEALPFVFGFIQEKIGVTEADLKSPIRRRDLVDGRKIFFGIVNHFFSPGLHRAGDLLNKDHATVIHSLRTHKNLLDTSPEYRERYNAVFDQMTKLVGGQQAPGGFTSMTTDEIKNLLKSKKIPETKTKKITAHLTKEALRRAKFPPNEIRRILESFGVTL